MPKKTHQTARKARYSLLDELCASPDQPLPKERQTSQLANMWEGLADLEKNPSPAIHSWEVCSDAVNLIETLIEQGIVEDQRGLLKDATNALAEAALRHRRTGAPIRLTGPGIQAVRGVLEDYAELMRMLPARTMVRCHRLTERRILEIHSGKRRSHDVEVVSL